MATDSTIGNLPLASTITSNDEVAIRRLTENYRLGLSGSITGVLKSNNISILGNSTSAHLNNIITDNTGVGPLVFANSPTLTNVTISDSASIGTAGSYTGTLTFYNTTSGSITLQAQTGALGTKVLLLPATNGTILTTSDISYGGAGAADDGKIAAFDDGGDLWATYIYLGDAVVQHGSDTPGGIAMYDSSGNLTYINTASDTGGDINLVWPDYDGTISIERVFTPESYGAARDGSTNDRVAIQSAIDACYTAGGGVVQLSAGNYRVQESSGLAILLKTGVKLRGMGMYQTVLSTDNASSSSPYCLIAPYAYNTTTTPYGAHELDIEDLQVTCTQYATGGANDNMHDLIGVAHCPKATISRVGFNTTRYHFAEINCSKNVTFLDCATVGDGNHSSGKFQLDNRGNCGQISTSARYNTSISGASNPSGTITRLAVTSTANFKVGDFVVITGANGASSTIYNRVGGFKITNIYSSTAMDISVDWPGNATTTGTIYVETPIENVEWVRYKDKAATSYGVDIAREFLELSHSNVYNIIRNVTIRDSILIPATFEVTLGGPRPMIGFDSSAYPLEFTNFKFINNTIRDGGHTGLTSLLYLHVPYDSNYPYRQVSGIEVSGNKVQNCGFLNFLVTGQSDSDTTGRTTVTSSILQLTDKVVVKNNLIEVMMKGSAATAQRPTRVIRLGACNTAICEGNKIYVPDLAPSNLYGLSWTLSVTSNYGFFFDHVRNLTVRDNTVESSLTTTRGFMYLHGFVYAVNAFEVSGFSAYQEWVNNNVIGIGSIGDNISHTFIELSDSGAQYSAWTSPRNLYCKGRWSGNRGSSGGTRPGDTWSTDSDNQATPCAVITSSATSLSSSLTYGRHDWWDGVPVIQTFSNAAVTVDPNTTHLIQTGSMSASRVVTIPHAQIGRQLTITDISGTVSFTNSLVLTRQGSDNIANTTTNTIITPYGSKVIVPDKVSKWTPLNRQYGYIELTRPHRADGTGATIGSTATALDYGHGTFSATADQAGNYVEYRLVVPEDFDSSVELQAYFKFKLNGNDTGKHRYVLSTVAQADSSSASGTPTTAINLDFTGDASGATDDIESIDFTTLTGWAATLTAKRLWVIRLARDGDDGTNDTSTTSSTEMSLVIKYGKL